MRGPELGKWTDALAKNAYQTYKAILATNQTTPATVIFEMANDAAQAVAISSDLSQLISSYDFETDPLWTAFTDLILSVGASLFEGWAFGETANDLRVIAPQWELAVKSANMLSFGLGLVDFSLDSFEVVAQIVSASNSAIEYYNSQDLSFLSSQRLAEYRNGFEALANTPEDVSDDYRPPDYPDPEPDNLSNASSLGVITEFVSLVGTIEAASDTDWFSMDLVAGRSYNFLLSARTTARSQLDPFLSLQLLEGPIWTNDDLSGTTLNSFLSIVAPVTGTYFLALRGVGTTTGEYLLVVSPLSEDETAQNLSPSSPSYDDVTPNVWHWQGTSGSDSPSELTLEQYGAPDIDEDNYYRGHDGDDTIYAGRGRDVVWGDDDEDRLYGEDGDDILRGGRDDDRLYGGDDDDILYGEGGDDRIYGDGTLSSSDNGDDIIFGGDGNDDLRGGPDNDYIKGEGDNDVIRGHGGNDELYGDEGNDELDGDDGDDLLFGGPGADDLEGDNGRDRLAGEGGDDTLEGGEQDDVLFGGDDDDTLQGGGGDDLLHGERGEDTAVFSDGNAGVTVNLFDESAISSDLGSDRLYDIENVVGSNGDDVIDGNHDSNLLRGDDGDDRIRGHNGNDTIYGGDGRDIVWGDEGDDSVMGDSGNDEIRGGRGADQLSGGSGDDHLRGEQDNDTIDGGTGVDTVFFWGEFDDFQITQSTPGTVAVTDLRLSGQEGTDLITNAEYLEFFDGRVSIPDFFGEDPVTMPDASEVTSDGLVMINVLENDQPNAESAWIKDVIVASGSGIASVVGGKILYDPNGEFEQLVGAETSQVTLSYTLETSGRKTVVGTVAIIIAAAESREDANVTTVPIPWWAVASMGMIFLATQRRYSDRRR